MNSETKTCQNCKRNFVIEPEDFDFYKKINVPPPTWCPECRLIRRLIFWNEYNLFRATHAKTEKEIFSGYHKDSGLKLYDHNYWWSDGWDPMEYGKTYDFSKPFFEQLLELWHEVPWPARSIWHLENSDYSNNASRLKNCYLCFDCDESDDCLYGVNFRRSKDSIDFNQSSGLELCYELFSCWQCYQTFFSIECGNCREVWFSRDCLDCTSCFGCANLRHKQYHIFNIPYTKDEYEKKLRLFNLGSYQALSTVKEQVAVFWLRLPFKYMHGLQNEDVVGEYIYHGKNVRYAYQAVGGVKDLKYCQRVTNGVADSYDYTHWGDNSELIYESIICGENCKNLKFCFECWPGCEDIEYCVHCHSSTNLFGCVGLKKKSYCILNKQYRKEEYEDLRTRIIKHMNEAPYTDKMGKIYKHGEFFPPEFSPLAYNETIAQDFFPLTREEAEARGFAWREPTIREYEITKKADDLPDSIHDAKEEISKEIISCESCSRAYRILPQEFKFYKRFSLPLPKLCHNCRYNNRIKFRNPMRWWRRQCMCDYKVYENFSKHEWHPESRCPNKFETSYAPEKPEIVYCEQCYNAEVV